MDPRMWYCHTCRKDVLKSRLTCKECGENQPAPGDVVVSSQSDYSSFAPPTRPPLAAAYASAYSAPQPVSASTSPSRSAGNEDLLQWEEEEPEPEPEPEMQAVLSKAQKRDALERLRQQSEQARPVPGSSSDQGNNSPVLSKPPDQDMLKTLCEMGMNLWGVEKALFYTQNSSIQDALDYYMTAEAVDPADFLQTQLDPSLYAVRHVVSSSVVVSQPPKISAKDREFLEMFKVSKCKVKGPHDLHVCLQWHENKTSGVIDRRRNPFKAPHYFPDLCPYGNLDNRFGERCLSRLDCSQCHNKTEQNYHPMKYKTTECVLFPNCVRVHCAFAHGPQEVRQAFDPALEYDQSRQKSALSSTAASSSSRSQQPRFPSPVRPLVLPPQVLPPQVLVPEMQPQQQPSPHISTNHVYPANVAPSVFAAASSPQEGELGDDYGDVWFCGVCEDANTDMNATKCAECTAFRNQDCLTVVAAEDFPDATRKGRLGPQGSTFPSQPLQPPTNQDWFHGHYESVGGGDGAPTLESYIAENERTEKVKNKRSHQNRKPNKAAAKPSPEDFWFNHREGAIKPKAPAASASESVQYRSIQSQAAAVNSPRAPAAVVELRSKPKPSVPSVSDFLSTDTAPQDLDVSSSGSKADLLHQQKEQSSFEMPALPRSPAQPASDNRADHVVLGSSFEAMMTTFRVADFFDNSLFTARLQDVTTNFSRVTEWCSAFPFLMLEECRSQIVSAICSAERDFRSSRFKIDVSSEGRDTFIKSSKDLHIASCKILDAQDSLHEVRSNYNCFALLVQNAPADAKLSAEFITRNQTLLCVIGWAIREETPTDVVISLAKDRSDKHLDFDRSSVCDGLWTLFFLGVPFIPMKRVWKALNNIFSAPTDFPVLMPLLKCARGNPPRDRDHNAIAPDARTMETLLGTEYKVALNESQRIAVSEVVLRGGSSPSVSIVHGPPGTGKSRTLCAILRGLLVSPEGLTVLATAPTRVAVLGLARMFMQCNPDWRLGDVILVGDKHRLSLGLSDYATRNEGAVDAIEGVSTLLTRIHIDERRDRIHDSISKSALTISLIKSLAVYAHGPGVTDTTYSFQSFRDSLQEAVDELQKHVNIFEAEWTSQEGLQSYVSQISDLAQRLMAFEKQVVEDWFLRKQSANPNRPNSQVNLISDIFYGIQRVISKIVSEKTPSLDEIAADCFKKARIVFSTVNGGGLQIFRKSDKQFQVTVIDEAAQLVESETAVVLDNKHLQHLILAGDDKQLPAMTTSVQASKKRYAVSMLERLIATGHEYLLLNEQYRMHPLISCWPNAQFYDSQVRDSDLVVSSLYEKSWHKGEPHGDFPPIAIYDVQCGREEKSETGSLYNLAEAALVRSIVGKIKRLKHPDIHNVGVISPYRRQVDHLEHLASKVDELDLRIQVSTVDGFQGQESDIIILTCVRSNSRGKLGFLEDLRRLNVAVTRAKFSLIVVCNVQTVSRNEVWKSLMIHVEVNQPDCVKFTADVSPELESLDKKMKKHEHDLSELTDKTLSNIFEHLPWMVNLHPCAKASMSKIQSPSVKSSIFLQIRQLGEGQRMKRYHSSSLVLPRFTDILWIYKLHDYYLIWSVDLSKVMRGKDKYMVQSIKIWDCVSEANLTKIVGTVQRILAPEHDAWLERCKQVSKKEGSEGLSLLEPLSWAPDSSFDALKQLKAKEHILKIELSVGTDAPALAAGGGDAVDDMLTADPTTRKMASSKVFPLSTAAMRLIIDGRTDFELPFRMSPEEDELVKDPHSLLVLGRSGTGKTTVLIHRMYYENQVATRHREQTEGGAAEEDKADSEFRQLLITASPILCHAIRQNYDKIVASTRGVETAAEEKEGPEARLTRKNSLPKSFLREHVDLLGEEFFPLVITYSDFLKMLDATLRKPFFKQKGYTGEIGKLFPRRGWLAVLLWAVLGTAEFDQWSVPV